MANPKLQLDLIVDDKGNVVLKDFGKEVEKTMDRAGRAASSVTNSFLGMEKVLTGMAGVAGIGMIAKSFYDVGIQADSMNRSLSSALGSMEEAAKAQEYLRRESDRLGLVFKDQITAYKGIAAAARGTALEGREVQNIYIAIAEASTALQLSSEETEGALNAVSQMISKGKVQAEELRGQLGERLPGAFQVAAKAMGVTTAELDKMLEQGKLVAEDFLPKFAAALRVHYAGGVKEASDSAQANINRLKNTWFDFQRDIMESGVTDAISVTIQATNKEFKQFWSDNEDNIKSFADDIKDLAEWLDKAREKSEKFRRVWDNFSLSSALGLPPDVLDLLESRKNVKDTFATTPETEAMREIRWAESQKKLLQTNPTYMKARSLMTNMPSTEEDIDAYLAELRQKAIDLGITFEDLDGQMFPPIEKTTEKTKEAITVANELGETMIAHMEKLKSASDDFAQDNAHEQKLKDLANAYAETIKAIDSALLESFDISKQTEALNDGVDEALTEYFREVEKIVWEMDGKRRLAEFEATQGLYDAKMSIIEAQQELELEADEERREIQEEEEKALQKRLLEDQKQALEEAKRNYEHFLNNLHDATASTFYDIFSGSLTTFEQFADRMKDYFIRVLAEMSAQAILEPVIVPVVTSAASTLGLGSLTGDASSGNLFSNAWDSVKTISSGVAGLIGLGGGTAATTDATIAAAEAMAAMETTAGSAGFLGTLGSGVSSALGVIGPMAAVAGLGYTAYNMMQGEPTEYYSTAKGTGGYSQYSGMTLGNISTGNSEYDQYLHEKLGKAQAEINSNINNLLGALDETARAQMADYLEAMEIQYGGSGADWTASDNGTGWTEIGNIRERIQRSMWTSYSQAIGQAGTLSDLGVMDGLEGVLAGSSLWGQYESLKDVQLGTAGYNAQFNAFFEDMADFREVWDQVSPILGESVSQAQSLVEVLEAVSDEFENYKETLEEVGGNVSALAELELARADKVSEIIEAAGASYMDAWNSFIKDVTLSDLAPVQSAESYHTQYYDLLEQAQGGDYEAYQELLSFLKNDYLPFAQDYGGDYQETWDRLFGQGGEVSTLKVDLGSVGTDISAGILEALGPYLETMDGDLHLTIKIGDQAMGQVIASQIRSNSDVVLAIKEAAS